ncbi:MAG: NlpC/P60 family protein, partial [Actinomycetota bacterium]|nr:NlpC/P60 family protein [Actinomycetota bacterium]
MRRATTGVARGGPPAPGARQDRRISLAVRVGALLAIAVLGFVGAGQAQAAPKTGQPSQISGLINQIAKANQ